MISIRTGHALVVGGSVAGIAAARMLTNYFERVMSFPQDPNRRG